MKERLKSALFVVGIIVGIVGLGVWYYLDGTDTLDPAVFAEAESTLKELDSTKDAAKDCAGASVQYDMWFKAYIEAESDPSISEKIKERNREEIAEMRVRYKKDREECEPIIKKYEKSYNRYLELFRQMKNSEKPRLIKLLNGEEEVETTAFDLEYSLKYSIFSKRFAEPE